MKLAIAGAAGAFGQKHVAAIQAIPDVQLAAVVDPDPQRARQCQQDTGADMAACHLDEILECDAIDGVILATPTPLHAQQAIDCLMAGKHVMVEIPMADNITDAERLVEVQQRSGKIAMAGHTRRFNPSHQWLHQRIRAGSYKIQQLNVQTYFFRRTNTNALGQPRTWTDHLLWHHACHTVDLFMYQTGTEDVEVQAMQGAIHPELGIAMDMAINLRTDQGVLCTLSLSFNNDGPLGTFFRYIGDTGSYIARYDELVDGYDRAIDLSQVAPSLNGIELQDREFCAAIQGQREPNASVRQCLPAMRVLDKIEVFLNGR